MARLLSALVLLLWTLGLLSVVLLLLVGLVIPPTEIGSFVFIAGLGYIAIFMVFLVPSALIFRHLKELASAIKSEEYASLLKRISSYNWVWVAALFSCLFPVGVVSFIKHTLLLLDMVDGYPIPVSTLKFMTGSMVALGSGLAAAEALLLFLIKREVDKL
jgi:hypothetical protein